jgi:hypothetical protein
VEEDSTGLQSGRRVTVDEAARHLGLTVDAVRKRVQRGQITHEKDAAGRVRIILDIPDNASTLQDERPDTAGQTAAGSDAREELIEELRDRVASLERQLQRHGDETERLHQIVAGLAQANAEQARTIRAIEAPTSQEPQDAETVEEEPERTEYQPETAGHQADAEPAPEAPESDEAGHQEEPQAGEASEGGPDDWTLPDSREQAEAAVVSGSDEEQHDAQDLEPAAADIAPGELRQEPSDDTPLAGQEEEAESRVSVEDQRDERAIRQTEWEHSSRRAKERRATSEAASVASRRRPWYRRIFGR